MILVFFQFEDVFVIEPAKPNQKEPSPDSSPSPTSPAKAVAGSWVRLGTMCIYIYTYLINYIIYIYIYNFIYNVSNNIYSISNII